MRNSFLKKISYFVVLIHSIFILSCSDDSADDPAPQVNNLEVIIKEFTFRGGANEDRIEIANNSSNPVDISNWAFCPAVGVYPPVSSLDVIEGSTNIPAGGSVILSGLDLGDADGALALYISGPFTDANNIRHFVQWGGDVNGDREDVAVAAGLWTAGAFIDISSFQTGNSLEFDGDGTSVSDWTIQTNPTLGADAPAASSKRAVIIQELSFQGDSNTDRFELVNTSSESVDVSGWFLCPAVGVYPPISSLNVVEGSTTIPAGGSVVFSGQDLGDNEGTLAIYNTNSFTDTSAIVDFVQWGADIGNDRETVAVSANLWAQGEFVDVSAIQVGNSIEYDGDGIAASDWAIQSTPTLGPALPPMAAGVKRAVVIKELTFAGGTDEDRFEIQNNGSTSIDVSSWFLCPAIGVYPPISSLTIIEGNTTIPAGGSIIFSGQDLGDTEGTLAIYNTNSFTDTSAIVDFVQWGANVLGDRENIAVDAGLWTANEFVDISALQDGNAIEYDGDGVSASDWAVQTNPSLGPITPAPAGAKGDIIIKELSFDSDASNDRFEIVNNGSSPVDISSWILCPAIGVYPPISSLTIVQGSTTIPAGGSVIFSGQDLGNTGGTLALYIDNSFSSPASIVDFVQWGSNVGNDRESVAVSANLWVSGEFVDITSFQPGNSIEFDGTGISASDWAVQTTPSLGPR